MPPDTAALAVALPPADTVFTAAIEAVVIELTASAFPLDELNPSILPFLSSVRGMVNVAAASLSCNLIALEFSSSASAIIVSNVSSSVFNFATSKAPPLGKSVVLANGIDLVITTVLPPVAPVTDVVTVPVAPSPPDTVYKDVLEVEASNVLATPSTNTFKSVLDVKNTKGTGKDVCVTP